MSIRKSLIAVLAVAIAIAFAPLSDLQAATLTPGSGPGVDNPVVKVAAKKATKKKAKKKGKKKSAKKAKSKGPGSCGAYMYYSKKDRKCADARSKK
jgi:ABC-type sugar transport system substrate-binding protein